MQENISFESIRRGNLREFEILFKKYFASMCMVAGKYIKNQQVAEDIVQDVFIRLWEKKKEYNDISDIQVFLYVLVKNRCIDYQRSKKNMVEYSQSELMRWEAVFHDIVREEEICRIIDDAIVMLPAQSGKIINLVLAGKQNKEISEMLGISVNSVKTLKYNALHTMRRILKEEYYALLLFMISRNEE